MMKNNKKNFSFNKTLLFKVVCLTFSVLFFTFIMIISGIIVAFRFSNWKIDTPNGYHRPFSPYLTIFLILIISILLGTALSIYFGNRFLKPIRELKVLTGEVARGNFKVEVDNVPDNEIGELINNFNVMVKELQKNELLKVDFISNVSHEFKTPLSTIQGYATLLQDENLSDDDKNKYCKIIFNATEKLTTLVNSILKLSKIDNRKITIEKISYSLDEQIRESILSFENKWNEKQLDLNIEFENVNIVADKNLLLNVWNNLIDNAIKYSPSNSKIDFSLTLIDNNMACFSIKDYGCGIPSESLPYIFDRFYQADKSHNIDGNGLGLALVKKIVALLNGTIEVESKLNEGSKFIVKLPLK